MKIAFVISSTIDTNHGKGQHFPYSQNRSFFYAEERLRQTQYTINTLNLIDDTSEIFLLESSKDPNRFKNNFIHVKNCHFINLENIDPAISDICTNHPSKGFCESLANLAFFKNYCNKLKKFDWVIKITGRYFFSSFEKKFLQEFDTDKYLIGKIRQFDWNHDWKYPDFLRHSNKLNWVPTWAYGVGNKNLDQFITDYQKPVDFYKNNTEIAPYMDFECLFYEYIIKNNSTISAPWTICGWNGVTGKFFTE